MTTLNDIEIAAKSYAEKCRVLRDLQEKLDRDIHELQSKYLENMKKASNEAGEDYQLLYTLLSDAECLFENKKTHTVHGVKFGYQKQKGKLNIINEDTTIAKIKELHPDQADFLIKTKETVIKKALETLTGAELKKLGVNIVEDSNEPFIKLTDSEVQKLIEAMIKESAKNAE